MTDRPFAGRLAVITGAAGDIGSATAVRLAAAGADLVLADIGGDLDDVSQRCRSARSGCEIEQARFDVTDEQAVNEHFAALASRGLVADLLFNNAGYQGDFTPIHGYDTADFRSVLDINVVGAFTVLASFCRHAIAAGVSAAAVNTASMAHVGAPNMAAYSASKAAVVAMTRTAALDLADYGIRVNAISPALIGPGRMWDRQVELQAQADSTHFSDDPVVVAKQMIGSVPLGRYGSLDEVAAGALFLLSDQASYITGFNLEIAGGPT